MSSFGENCPYCGSGEVTASTEPDSEGECEYHCDACGEYFVAEAHYDAEEPDEDYQKDRAAERESDHYAVAMGFDE